MVEVKQKFKNGVNTTIALTGLSQADFELLKEAAPQARQWCSEIVQVFYDTLYQHSRTAAIFRDGERPAREETLAQWYLSLFEVNSVTDFLRSQAPIGLAHIRRRVNNQFMIGIMVRVSEIFQANALETLGPDYGLKVAQAFERALNAVVGLTAEGYDVMSNVAFSESTGAEPELINHLIQQSIDDVEQKLRT